VGAAVARAGIYYWDRGHDLLRAHSSLNPANTAWLRAFRIITSSESSQCMFAETTQTTIFGSSRWRYGQVSHDAAYHAVAIVNGGCFVTADARYVNKTAGSGSVVVL
jgi:hypothetical protein